MEAELKIVVQLKGTRALVGVQAPDTDLVVETIAQCTGTLEEILAYIPGILARARERWATNRKNPAYVGPPPPPAPPRQSVPVSSRQPQVQQREMF